jgi:hypothetical protein
MLLNLLDQTLGKFLAPDEPGGPIKFGGVEVDLNAEPEVIKAAMLKAQETYNASSTAGIESAKNLKDMKVEFEALKKSKEKAGGPGLTAEDVKKIMQEQMGDFTAIADKGRQLNLDRSNEQSRKELRSEFAFLDDKTFNEVIADVDVDFKNQDAQVRTGNVYKNMLEHKLGKSLRKNIDSVNKDKAMELLMGNPEAMKELIDGYSKKMGIDVNMPQGGVTNQKDFETKISGYEAEFAKERNSDKRKVLVQKIADTRAVGANLGYKL